MANKLFISNFNNYRFFFSKFCLVYNINLFSVVINKHEWNGRTKLLHPVVKEVLWFYVHCPQSETIYSLYPGPAPIRKGDIKRKRKSNTFWLPETFLPVFNFMYSYSFLSFSSTQFSSC